MISPGKMSQGNHRRRYRGKASRARVARRKSSGQYRASRFNITGIARGGKRDKEKPRLLVGGGVLSLLPPPVSWGQGAWLDLIRDPHGTVVRQLPSALSALPDAALLREAAF